MKKKLLKIAISIMATIILTPIFVVGIMNISDLFPKRTETGIEEVNAYVPRDVNEQFFYGDGDFDYLTDKDTFTYKTEDDSFIKDYKEKNLFGSTTKFRVWDPNKKSFGDNEYNYINNDWATYQYVVTGDDPIVKLIPRELFNCRGAYTIAGKEWGFFVKTEPFNAYEDDGTNKVTIMVFDIKQTQLRDPNERLDTITSSVTVLFQYEYRFLKRDSAKIYEFNTRTLVQEYKDTVYGFGNYNHAINRWSVYYRGDNGRSLVVGGRRDVVVGTGVLTGI